MKLIWTPFKKAETPKTIGRLLKVQLPLLGIQKLRAKVDTGAFSGALHATNIREITDEQGVKQLSFALLGDANRTVQTESYHKRRVKSSNGQAASRYAIDTEIEIFGQRYPITLTLANRSVMKYQMLIGNFLRRHGFLVDVNWNNR
jgi:hypothetical protein